jgi:hypothetical protein
MINNKNLSDKSMLFLDFATPGQLIFQDSASPIRGNYDLHHGIFFYLVLFLAKFMDVLRDFLRASINGSI